MAQLAVTKLLVEGMRTLDNVSLELTRGAPAVLSSRRSPDGSSWS